MSLKEARTYYDVMNGFKGIMDRERHKNTGLHDLFRRRLGTLMSFEIYRVGSEVPTNELSELPDKIIKDILTAQQNLCAMNELGMVSQVSGPWGLIPQGYQPVTCYASEETVSLSQYVLGNDGYSRRPLDQKSLEKLFGKEAKNKQIPETIIHYPSRTTMKAVTSYALYMTDYLLVAGDHEVVPLLRCFNSVFSDIILEIDNRYLNDELQGKIEKFVLNQLQSKHLRKIYLNSGHFSRKHYDELNVWFQNFVTKPNFEWLDMPNAYIESSVARAMCKTWREKKIFAVATQDVRTHLRNSKDLKTWLRKDFRMAVDSDDMKMWELDEIHSHDAEQTMRVVVVAYGRNPTTCEVSLVFQRQADDNMTDDQAKKENDPLSSWWAVTKKKLAEGQPLQ